MRKREHGEPFVKTYARGWNRVRWLIKEAPVAARLYTILVENMGMSTGATSITMRQLAKAEGISERTTKTWMRWLVQHDVVRRVGGGGHGAYIYSIDPQEHMRGGIPAAAQFYKAKPAEPLHDEDGTLLPGRPRHLEPSKDAIRMREYRASKKADAAVKPPARKKRAKPKLALVPSLPPEPPAEEKVA